MTDNTDVGVSEAIRSHPLFNVVTLLVHKCEEATWTGDYKTDISDVIKLLRECKTKNYNFKSDDPQVDSLLIEAILEFQRHLRQIHRLYALSEVYLIQKKEQLKERTTIAVEPLQFRMNPLQDMLEAQRRPRQKFTINEILGKQYLSE